MSQPLATNGSWSLTQSAAKECTRKLLSCDPTLACGVVTCFGRQWELQEFTDFTVYISGKDFKCHRIILESCSKFFSRSQNGCSLTDIKPEIFELILEVLYKGRNILTVDNIMNVWHAACKLEIGFLVQVCEEFVRRMITVDNYMDIYRTATSLNSGKVLHAMKQKIVQEFHHFMLSDTFLELTLENILAVLGSQDIKVCANGLVQAIFTWVKAEVCDGWDNEQKKDAPCPAKDMDVNKSENDKGRTTISDRHKHLEVLLKVANLENISDDCLTWLMTNDMLVTCPGAVLAINSIAVQRLNFRKASGLETKTCTRSGECLLHQPHQQVIENEASSSQTPTETTSFTSTVDPVLACGIINRVGLFWDLQTFSDISDFTVKVGRKNFKCHKFILGSCSEFFSGLLRSDMKEKAENSAEIKGIRSCIFELILEVLYTGGNILTTDNMIEVWHAANQLQIVFLIQTCEEYTMENLTIENCVDIYKNAILLMSEVVLQTSRQLMAQRFDQIMISDSFSGLSVDDLLEIFNSKDMKVCANGLVHCVLKRQNVGTSAEGVDLGVENETAGFVSSLSSNTLQTDALTPFVSDRLRDLEKLMKAVKLDSVTDDCLKKLMCNEMVLATPNVIRAVNAIAVQRWNFQTQKPSTSCSENCSGNDYCPLHQAKKI